MSKQTAVEWLIEKMHKNIEWIPVPMQEQAKEMEKEQIIDAFDTGRRKGDWIFDGEKYYEETYKNENK
jgi:hypothetical protein